MGRNGLVFVDVDGLSHTRLLAAIERGHMPFVAGAEPIRSRDNQWVEMICTVRGYATPAGR